MLNSSLGTIYNSNPIEVTAKANVVTAITEEITLPAGSYIFIGKTYKNTDSIGIIDGNNNILYIQLNSVLFVTALTFVGTLKVKMYALFTEETAINTDGNKTLLKVIRLK